MKIQPYLAFSGNCREAMDFYAGCFGGEVINRQTYANQKIDVPGSYRDKLQHAEVKGKGVHFMGYDAAPDTPLTQGNQIHMSIDSNDREEAKTIFGKLAAKGQVHHDFREREWGAYFGRLRDKYGIHWMVNCDK